MQKTITRSNFQEVLEEIKCLQETKFDFSRTDFQSLDRDHIKEIFITFGQLPYSVTLILNHCIFHESSQHWEEFILRIQSIQTIRSFEFNSVLSNNALIELANSLKENHSIEIIMIDGPRVAPEEVRKSLTDHPAICILNGIPLTEKAFFDRPSAQQQDPNWQEKSTLFFRKAAKR